MTCQSLVSTRHPAANRRANTHIMSITSLLPTGYDRSGAPVIELRGVSKRFLSPKGQYFTALRNVNLTVQAGEFCAVVGPTGCGKSTTLGLISGLERPSMGEVEVMGNVSGIIRKSAMFSSLMQFFRGRMCCATLPPAHCSGASEGRGVGACT